VKTLTDVDHALVVLTPVPETVHHLRALTRPHSPPANNRVVPVELTTYQVRALLIGWKLETADHDLHVVIANPRRSSETMVVEIPNPDCAAVCASGHTAQFNAARQVMISRFGQPPTRFTRVAAGTMVTVTGVGFFDFAHGQTGRAPNSIRAAPSAPDRVRPLEREPDGQAYRPAVMNRSYQLASDAGVLETVLSWRPRRERQA
jgi:hypothetical protein